MWNTTLLRRLSLVLAAVTLVGCATEPKQGTKLEDPVYLYQMGVSQLNQGHFQDAANYFKESIRIDGANPGAWNSLGLTYLLDQRLPDARASFEKAIQLQSSFADAHNNLGVTFLQQGELAAAERELNLARQDTVYSQMPALWLNLGLVALAKGSAADAVGHLGDAIARNKEYAPAYLNRSKAYEKMGQPDQAKADLIRYLELRPEDPEGLFTMGRMLMNEKAFAEARPLLEKVWLLAPSSTWGIEAKKELDKIPTSESAQVEEVIQGLSNANPPSDEVAGSIIRPKCEKEWPDDFSMRAFCEKQQKKGLEKLRQRQAISPTMKTIREKCAKEWPDDFGMRNYCEEKQIDAVHELQK